MAGSDNWGTPAWLADLATDVLVGIDLDPCSTVMDNLVVGAERILTAEDNGLTSHWGDEERVFCNPPGGNSRLVKAFWARCVEHTAPVFWIGFNLGQLRYLHPSPLLLFPWGILKRRVAFRDPEGRGRSAGRYDNYVCLAGAIPDGMAARFAERLSPYCSALRA